MPQTISPCRQSAVERMHPKTAKKLETLHASMTDDHASEDQKLAYVTKFKNEGDESHERSKKKLEDIDSILADHAPPNPSLTRVIRRWNVRMLEKHEQSILNFRVSFLQPFRILMR